MVKPPAGGGLEQHLRSNKTSNLASYIRSSRYLNKLAFLSAISAFALSFLMLNPPVLSTDEASATTGTATASTTSITLTSLDNSATVDIASLTPSGSFTTSTVEQSASFSLTTNNYTGYTLSIVANDDNGTLSTTPEPGDTPETISSISTITSTEDFSASTTTAAENYNNKWGFRPNKYVDATNNTVVDNTGNNPVYLPSPTTTPTLLDKTSTANTTTANTYTLALGLRANQDTKAGTYTKTFNLVVTANPISYTINYNQNTVDTVTNMPTTQASDTSSTSITLTNTVPQRSHYSFIGWCSTQPTTTNGVDSCNGTTYNPNGAGTNLTYGIDQTTANTTTLYAMWKIDTFTQTTEVRYENADGTWGNYTTVDTQNLRYGSSYSWSTAQITNFDSAAYQAASVSSYTVTEAHTNQVSIYRNTFTCTKQYRLEAGNGDWGNYDPDGAIENVRYGSTCSYTKNVDYYTSQTASVDNVTSNQTLSVSLPRTTYSLTVSAGSNTSNPTGSGTYRWGQVVLVSVDKNENITCTSYSTPTWTATAGTAPAAGASTSFTMPTSNATITATSAASSVAQTITLSRSGGASGINIGGTNYTGSSVSLTCGTYNISGNYDSNYEFSSWSASGSASVASTSSATTTMTVSGPGTLTLTGKSSKLWFQNATSAQCGQTMYDNRGTDAYKDIAYSTALINDLCWMTRNLDLPGGTTLTADDSNVSAGCALGGTNNCTLPASSTSGFSDDSTAYVYNGNGTTCGDGSPCYSYYSYVAATAGTNPSSGEATSDICPKGWRLPTKAEFDTLKYTYYTGATLTASPFFGVYSGDYYNSSFLDGGSRGYYCSSTAVDASRAYLLFFYSSYVNTGFNNKSRGHPIRCVLQ